MKLEIDISDMYVETLSKWASVSRTFDGVIDALHLAQEAATTDAELEQINWTLSEVRTLQRPLDALQKAAQAAIWAANRAELLG